MADKFEPNVGMEGLGLRVYAVSLSEGKRIHWRSLPRARPSGEAGQRPTQHTKPEGEGMVLKLGFRDCVVGCRKDKVSVHELRRACRKNVWSTRNCGDRAENCLEHEA